MSWQFVGIVFCLGFAFFAAVMCLIETYRIHRYKRKKIHRGPHKDWKRNGVESAGRYERETHRD